eukprot:CAMPEP_0194072298 /NCGR_PEP_ID=MMETSP0149-20130528/61_1 /TAXON_ID=122233 /ORGANISM="Chaetoceros debilis, Strain MM31A-1" /LENGTH=80 /DNA_ID=CAMNT_0038752157 /DNA_START=35 /DNA_END=274 /DNA_ORIENTATION=-
MKFPAILIVSILASCQAGDKEYVRRRAKNVFYAAKMPKATKSPSIKTTKAPTVSKVSKSPSMVTTKVPKATKSPSMVTTK